MVSAKAYIVHSHRALDYSFITPENLIGLNNVKHAKKCCPHPQFKDKLFYEKLHLISNLKLTPKELKEVCVCL